MFRSNRPAKMASAKSFALGVQGEETFGGQAPLRTCASRLPTPFFGGNRNSVRPTIGAEPQRFVYQGADGSSTWLDLTPRCSKF